MPPVLYGPSAFERKRNVRIGEESGHGCGWAPRMKIAPLWFLTVLTVTACSPSLPNGYAVIDRDRGKSWLANPDGTIVHGAVIKQLFIDGQHILLVAPAAVIDGSIDGPRPLDGNCYIALLIDSRDQRTRQLRLAEARRLAANMTLVASSNPGCLEGMPTS